MSQQGGPGNEKKPPEQQVFINQSVNADRIMAVCFLMATQRLLRLGVWPALMKPDSPSPADKLEFLLQEIRREINFVDVHTPKEGDDGNMELTCTSHTSELTRSNPDTRSQDSQDARLGFDAFFNDVVAVSDWNIFWGQKQG